jgi:PAS domain S-box-containing protein
MTSRRILVVEDNPTTRKMLRIALESDGYLVIEAGDGREAIEAQTRQPAELVLQDIVLPDMNGFELVRRLRAMPGGRELPILALSGFLGRIEDAESAEAGFTALLVKPIEPSRLLETIHGYLPIAHPPDELIGKRQRIILADDDPVQLKLTRMYFEQLDFHVTTASSASEALASARAAPPDVIVSDVLMPGMDGFDLSMEVRRDPQLARVPVVLISAWYQTAADLELAKRVGASALINRTSNLRSVADAVVDAIDKGAPDAVEEPTERMSLEHARLVIRQLERHLSRSAALARRCTLQAAQISMLSGVADALTRKADVSLALRDVLAATLDAAGISKGALFLRNGDHMELGHALGFSPEEQAQLTTFFGDLSSLERTIEQRATITIPSNAIDKERGVAILQRAGVASMHIVPLVSEAKVAGAMILGAKSTDLTSDDAVAFARAMGNQLTQSLALTKTFERLEASEKKSRWLVDSNIIGIASWQREHGVDEANDAFLKTVGYTREDLEAGALRSGLTPPEYEAHDLRALQEIAERGQCTQYEKELARKDGSRVSVMIGAASFPGFTDRGVSFIVDITDRKRAELEVGKQELRFRALIEKSTDVITLTSPDLICTYISPSVRHILGYEPEDLVARGMSVCLHPDEVPIVRRIRERLEPGEVSAPYVIRTIHKDGSMRWMEGTSTNLIHDPSVGAIVSNFRDVTERRRLEEQLRQAQKMEAIGSLAGGVAHDFNNLLSVILAYSDLIASDLKPSDAIYADVAEIRGAGQRAADLTKQLLAFSRKQMLQPRVVDLNAIVAASERMLRRLIGEDIELTVFADKNLDRILVDPGQVEQVIMNLAVNARDAMVGGGKLTIETKNVLLDEHYASEHPEIQHGPHVMFAMTDTGTGMSPATQARIFEPFFTTKETGRGTGLGLSTVFGIVKQSGGSIWVYSEEGRGTTFKVYLPSTTVAATARVDPIGGKDLRGGETILLVEDDEAVRVVVRTILERHGYNVLEALSPANAISICEKHETKIDLLLTDVVMPKMSGRQLADRLRPMRAEMKVLFMSGYTDNAIVHHGVLDHGVLFIEKPILPEALARKVREALEG